MKAGKLFVWLVASSLLPIALIATVQPVAAASVSSEVVDPLGDAMFNAPAYQDIVRSVITRDGSSFELLIELAGAVPANPALPPPAVAQIWWVWAFNLDPSSFPAGYPFAPGVALPADFVVYVSFDGTAFQGFAIDRRPLVSGGLPLVTQVLFVIDGAQVRASVEPVLLGDPTSFGWGTRVFDWSGPIGSEGASVVDFGGPPFSPFPS